MYFSEKISSVHYYYYSQFFMFWSEFCSAVLIISIVIFEIMFAIVLCYCYHCWTYCFLLRFEVSTICMPFLNAAMRRLNNLYLQLMPDVINNTECASPSYTGCTHIFHKEKACHQWHHHCSHLKSPLLHYNQNTSNKSRNLPETMNTNTSTNAVAVATHTGCDVCSNNASGINLCENKDFTLLLCHKQQQQIDCGKVVFKH